MWLVHAGHRVDARDAPSERFPAERVPDVRHRVGALLDALEPGAVVSAAAAGADLLLLTEAIERDIPIHVVLPLEEATFVDRSVADRPGAWVAQFDDVIAHARGDTASSLTIVDLSGDDRWYLVGNLRVLDRAQELADEPVVALVVITSGDDASATSHFASAASGRGLVVLAFDPMGDDEPTAITPR